MLENDVKKVQKVLASQAWFSNLSAIRQRVVTDMAFNLGTNGFFKFKKMIRAIENGNYNEAAKQMLDSKWSRQVGSRAIRLAEMMRKDTDYV